MQTMPTQEPGTRPARPLPYAVYTTPRVDSEQGRLWIKIRNEGKAGAALYARNSLIPQHAPRRYSVSAGKAVEDYWLPSDNGSFLKKGTEFRSANPDYDVILHGPNGLYTHLRGLVAFPDQPWPEASIGCDHATGDVRLSLSNHGTAPDISS